MWVGGDGSLLLPVLEGHPEMRLTVFDLPHVADAARARIAKAGLSDRCDAVGGDAFKAVPAGADAYVLKGVIHDWEDSRMSVRQPCLDAACRHRWLAHVDSHSMKRSGLQNASSPRIGSSLSSLLRFFPGSSGLSYFSGCRQASTCSSAAPSRP